MTHRPGKHIGRPQAPESGQLNKHSPTSLFFNLPKISHPLVPTPSGEDPPLRGLSGWWPEWRQDVLGRGHPWAVAPGLEGRVRGLGLGYKGQSWTAQVLWAALSQPTRSLCIHLPATVSRFLWKREGGKSGSQLWAA